MGLFQTLLLFQTFLLTSNGENWRRTVRHSINKITADSMWEKEVSWLWHNLCSKSNILTVSHHSKVFIKHKLGQPDQSLKLISWACSSAGVKWHYLSQNQEPYTNSYPYRKVCVAGVYYLLCSAPRGQYVKSERVLFCILLSCGRMTVM